MTTCLLDLNVLIALVEATSSGPMTSARTDIKRIDPTRLLHSDQVTDSYLLALARAHQGQLASFDRKLVVDAVPGGAQALHLI